MEFQPIDLKALVGVTLGMLVVLIPIIGATIRFSAKPLVDALVRGGVIGSPQAQALALGAGASQKDLELVSRRLRELEQEVNKLKGLVRTDTQVPPRVVQLEEGESEREARLVELQRARVR
jgi:aldehyde:ferredoxin oxidoreductase